MKHFNSAPIYFAALFTLLTVSCSQKKQHLTLNDVKNIEKYLDTKVMAPAQNGVVLSAHKVLMQKDNTLYVWAYMQEYYKSDGKLMRGSGWSVPMILTIEQSADGIMVKNHKYPGDGELYSKEVRELFPTEIQQQIFDFPASQDLRKLEEILSKRSKNL